MKILFLPYAFHSTIKRAEQTTPHPEIPSKNGRTRFDGGKCANASLAIWRISVLAVNGKTWKEIEHFRRTDSPSRHAIERHRWPVSN